MGYVNKLATLRQMLAHIIAFMTKISPGEAPGRDRAKAIRARGRAQDGVCPDRAMEALDRLADSRESPSSAAHLLAVRAALECGDRYSPAWYVHLCLVCNSSIQTPSTICAVQAEKPNCLKEPNRSELSANRTRRRVHRDRRKKYPPKCTQFWGHWQQCCRDGDRNESGK
jgi:hypothetical protein